MVDKPDATGTYYRRNRSYDPNTARFTQEDPLGLAGGLNVYGFAGGDPVDFSDPFGLCPIPPDDCPGISGSDAAQVFAQLSRMAPAINKSVAIFGVVTMLPAVTIIATDGGTAAVVSEVASEAAPEAEPAAESSPGALQAMERQFARDGANSLEKTITRLTKNIAEHEAKIAEAVQRGGTTSSMEREVRAWQETIRAAQQVLERKP